MNCKHCNAKLPDGAGFCSACGRKVEPVSENTVFCTNCGAPIGPGELFCGNCGTKNSSAPRNPGIAPRKSGKKSEKMPIRIPPKALRWALVAAAAVVVVVLAVSLFSGGSDSHVVYLKDSQLQYLPVPKGDDPLELTDELFNGSRLSNYEQQTNLSSRVTSRLLFSSDGKKLFYPDTIDGDTYTLYCQDLSNTKKDPVKIDSDLSGSYYLNEKGNLVTYSKGGKLYQHDLKEKTKIASDIGQFYVSDDGKTLLYQSDGNLFLKKGSADAEKIVSEVESIIHVSDDLSMILYKKDGSLCRMKNGKDPEKIASDVAEIWVAYDSGECYYTKKEEDTIRLGTMLHDDVGTEESKSILEWMKDETINNPFCELYYNNGKENILITDKAQNYSYTNGDETMLAYSAFPGEDLPQVNVSEYLEGGTALTILARNALKAESRFYATWGDKTVELPEENISWVTISNKKTLWLGTDWNADNSTYTLKKVTLSGDTVKNIEEIDDDVKFISLVNDTDCIYWKFKSNDTVGKLYMNGEKIADDARLYSVGYKKDSNLLYYLEDYNSIAMSGTLTCWNGKKAVTVQDDVYSFLRILDDQVVYLHDYSTKNFKGDLSIWNGKKAIKLDDDVVAILRAATFD